MRRKFKRKVFMMGMAVSATLPISTTAKASGKPDSEEHPYSGWQTAQLIVPGNLADDGEVGKVSFISKLKTLFGGAGYGSGAVQTYPGDKGWQMELLQNPGNGEGASDIRQARDKRFGVSFRLSF